MTRAPAEEAPDTAQMMIRTARLFEWYVRWVWPLQRRWSGRHVSRRCVRCAASEKMSPLGSDGTCAACAQPTAPRPRVAAEEAAGLQALLASYQGRGAGPYDALVPYSGGKDSTYLIRRVQEEHPGLRLLAFTLDNGFMSPVAVQNVLQLLPRLDVDHVFVRPRRSFYRTLFRYTLTHLNAAGSYGTVDFSDGEFMLDTARRLAAEKRIPLILCGYSRYQVEDGLRLSSFESPPSRERQDRTEVAGLPLSDIFSEAERQLWWQGAQVPPADLPRLLFPLFAWDLEEAEIKRQVTAWGLLGENNRSPVATNHQLIPLLGVVDVHRFGYSSFEPEFCRMIREGKASRAEWQPVFEFLEYCARTGSFVKPLVVRLLARLGLTQTEVGIRFPGER